MGRIRSSFNFNNRNSTEFGLRLLNEISIPHPTRRYQRQDIPGRNGTTIYDDQSFDPIDMTFPMRIFCTKNINKRRTLFEMEKDIVSWLMADPGWHDLVFMDDPEWIYKAIYEGGGSVNRITSWEGSIDIRFLLHPFKFLKTGQDPITYSSGLKIYNQTAFKAYPILSLTGSGNVNISFTNSGQTETLNLLGLSGPITINTELGIAYNGSTPLDNKLGTVNMPTLRPGENTVSVSGSVSSLTICPNLMTLV